MGKSEKKGGNGLKEIINVILLLVMYFVIITFWQYAKGLEQILMEKYVVISKELFAEKVVAKIGLGIALVLVVIFVLVSIFQEKKGD